MYRSLQYVATEMTRLVLPLVGSLQIKLTRLESVHYFIASPTLLCALSHHGKQPTLISHYIRQLNVNYKQLLSICQRRRVHVGVVQSHPAHVTLG